MLNKYYLYCLRYNISFTNQAGIVVGGFFYLTNYSENSLKEYFDLSSLSIIDIKLDLINY